MAAVKAQTLAEATGEDGNHVPSVMDRLTMLEGHANRAFAKKKAQVDNLMTELNEQ